ncbi:MAG: acetyltransferase [Flavobacteriaceae bacterium]|nr:MAG: acetyltransferase [Flavobacteriaceae bacterium]
MQGETNLEKLLKEMQPELNTGEYVFATVASTDFIKKEHILSEFKEKEGITVILERQHADLYQLSYNYIASWITLNVHSSLDAVGLTALFSTELARHQISCNVISGYYHDHIFVNQKDGQKAMEVLQKLSK